VHEKNSGGIGITLLGGFRCVNLSHPISLPHGARRLLALVAVQRDGVHRATAIERLWPDSPRRRAAANLRSALWQARRISGPTVIESDHSWLRLNSAAHVDLHEQISRVHDLLVAPTPDEEWLSGTFPLRALGQELLPAWSDDWLVLERERWNQIRLQALEALAQHLLAVSQYLPAIEAALAAVSVEPFRENAHRLLIDVHLAEGNMAYALKHYQDYRSLLLHELGVTPSDQMDRLIQVLIKPHASPDNLGSSAPGASYPALFVRDG
jgi:DNA-binding SARP family transcriptional activator